jgi:hypothetical protein
MAIRIPESASDVSEEWLTAILRESEYLSKDNSVVSVERDSHGAGLGYLSEIERIKISYLREESDAPGVVIAKFPTSSEKSRALATLFDSYSREVLFYKELASSVEVAIPRCFWADIAPETFSERLTGRIVKLLPEKMLVGLLDKLLAGAGTSSRRSGLLLEDLSGDRVGDQVEGCNLEEAQAALRSLAKFQSTFWGRSFDEVPWIHNGAYQSQVQHGLFMKALPTYMEVFKDDIDEQTSKQLDWLIDNGAALLEANNTHATLNHGDFRLDNLFFQSNGEDPILIDFQTVNVFNPMADVAYFLLPNLNDEAQKSVGDLVRFYWDALTDNGVSDYSWEDCLRDYDLAQWWLVHRGVILIGLIDFSHPRGSLLIETAVRRGLRAGLSRLPLPW